MRRRTPELYDILANVRRTIEGDTLARIADPCRTLMLRNGKLVPVFRLSRRPCARSPGDRLIANPAIAVAL